MKQQLILFLILFSLLAGCTLQSVTQPRRPDPSNEPTPVPTSVAIAKPTYTVQQGTVVARMIFSARIAPAVERTLSFPLAGQVDEVLVAQGNQVAAGDLLATLDTQAVAQELAGAEAALAVAEERLAAVESQVAMDRRRAEIALERAQLKLDFARQQAGEEPAPDEALEIRLLEFDVELADIALSEIATGVDPLLRSDVTQAQLKVDELRQRIAASQLLAPVDGTVLTVMVDAGQAVTAGEPVLVLADLSQLEIRGVVHQNDLDALAEGMPALVTVPGRPGAPMPATIRELPHPYGSGEAESEGATETIHLDFDNATDADDYSAGDRLSVAVVLDERENVLWLPPAAIREFNGRHFAVVQVGDVQRRVDVKLGIQGDDRIELVEGVALGDIVVGP